MSMKRLDKKGRIVAKIKFKGLFSSLLDQGYKVTQKEEYNEYFKGGVKVYDNNRECIVVDLFNRHTAVCLEVMITCRKWGLSINKTNDFLRVVIAPDGRLGVTEGWYREYLKKEFTHGWICRRIPLRDIEEMIRLFDKGDIAIE